VDGITARIGEAEQPYPLLQHSYEEANAYFHRQKEQTHRAGSNVVGHVQHLVSPFEN
jgi:hypothetical protein